MDFRCDFGKNNKRIHLLVYSCFLREICSKQESSYKKCDQSLKQAAVRIYVHKVCTYQGSKMLWVKSAREGESRVGGDSEQGLGMRLGTLDF